MKWIQCVNRLIVKGVPTTLTYNRINRVFPSHSHTIVPLTLVEIVWSCKKLGVNLTLIVAVFQAFGRQTDSHVLLIMFTNIPLP